MSQAEAEFFSFVARERAALRGAEKARAEVPDLLSWLEREIREAHEAMLSATLRRNEAGQNYWKGYEDALRDVKNLIERREVRA